MFQFTKQIASVLVLSADNVKTIVAHIDTGSEMPEPNHEKAQ